MRPQGRNRLRQAMDLAGVTQVQLAEAIGRPQPEISKVCLGKYGASGLPVERARPLAEFFGCSIEDLFPATKAA